MANVLLPPVQTWLLVSVRHFLNSREALQTWVELAENYWRQFVWSPYHARARNRPSPGGRACSWSQSTELAAHSIRSARFTSSPRDAALRSDTRFWPSYRRGPRGPFRRSRNARGSRQARTPWVAVAGPASHRTVLARSSRWQL